MPENQNKSFSELQLQEIGEESVQFFNKLTEMKFPELTVEETDQLKNMLWEERNAFSQHPDEIGSAPELQLHLQTTDETPVQKNYNAIPKHLYSEVRSHIQSMLDRGWIQKSKSSWSSPVVVVKKKDGGFRLCCDFRQLNKKTIPDKHPLPRIQEALDNLQGSAFFTVLDLSRAYYQGFMAPDSCNKTAFVTPWGFYEWVRIPFGLANAVPAFQRFMEGVLEGYRDNFALPYLDDTIVHSQSVAEHINHIREVLRKFQEKGLKLNLSKCVMFQREVPYLGRIVSKEGYKMDEKNVKAVRELIHRKFQTVGEVRQLLGLLGYHRRHVQNFATIAKPLTDLLGEKTDEKNEGEDRVKKGAIPSSQKITWEKDHQQALENLIHQITNPPILAYPDFKEEFFLHTDASAQGLGAILYQKQEGKHRVIAYASRTLKPSEQNYHSTKLEFIAMKWAITQQFRDYLSYADHFKVYTDNNPLLFVMGLTKPNATIQRWISELAEYHFEVFYRPGSVNRDADCLSRLPLDVDTYIDLCEESTSLDIFQQLVATVSIDKVSVISHLHPDTEVLLTASAALPECAPPLDIEKDQAEDEYIKPVLEIIKDGTTEKIDLQPYSRLLLRERSKLYIDDEGILRRKSGLYNQIVLPLKHRAMIYKTLHEDMGHLGAERVWQLARQRVFWPKMQADIEEYTQQRCRCLTQREGRQKPVAPMVSIHSMAPMELVAIDYLHLDKSSSGHEYVLLIVDHFTRYAQSYPTKNKTASAAAKHLYNDFILRFGLPSKILHDQGKEFENNLFKKLEEFTGITKLRTTPYHPQTNGAVERMNSTLLQMLWTLPENQKSKWPEKLNKLTFAYNATKHCSTGYSPHFLLFGREPRLPLDICLGQWPQDASSTKNYEKFVKEWEDQMREAYRIAQEKCSKVKSCAEERWRKRIIATELKPGDKVLVKNKREQGGPGKLRARWEQDVYEVLKQNDNGVVYEVQKLSDKKGEKRVLHRNMLLPCEMMEEPNSVSEAGRQQSQARSTIQTRSQKKQDSEALQSIEQESSSEDEEDQIYFAPYSVSPDTTETGQPSFTGIQHPIEDSSEFSAETEELGAEAEESQELPMLDRQTLTEEQLEGDPIELVDTTPPASVELEQFAFDSAESLEQEAVDDEQPGGSQKVRSSQREGRPPETFTFLSWEETQ